MNRNHSKIVFISALIVILFVLSSCGLNRRSASGTDPVVVEPIDVTVTDPTTDQGDGGTTDNGGDNSGGDTSTGDNGATDNGSVDNSGDAAGDNNSGEGATDTSQPVDGAGEGTTTDPTPEPEAPRDDATEEAPAVDPTAEAPAAENPTPAPATAVPPAGTAGTHPVQAGETLFTIALRYGLTVEELAAANGITNVNILSAGQELIIPVPGSVDIPQTEAVHIVSYGDTFYSIALRYGLTVEELAAHNNITDVNRIDIGQEIKIPASAGK